eukprot:gnl/TRDRNA2_/TRDRNA2_86423_c0_seq1.p1 gnl/TRDRNA2_/TRDRNA2_86423_c0~~gnl/TRDRNA2_/TRDRNA2_86423_c0_seq1.p1  ORF type:complete len:229 (-),score=35.65 gnl/TRDRNA2_/TRDRNA2_86423_c0_seq1:160-846(-)
MTYPLRAICEVGPEGRPCPSVPEEERQALLAERGDLEAAQAHFGEMAYAPDPGDLLEDELRTQRLAAIDAKLKAIEAMAAKALECHGKIMFEQTDAETCKITYEIMSLNPGQHGFHVHETADFSNGCLSAGPYVGILGNIEAGTDGAARGEILDRLIKLEGATSVIGQSIIVHADPDNLGLSDNTESDSKPPMNSKVLKVTGNAGVHIAAGEIRALRSLIVNPGNTFR